MILEILGGKSIRVDGDAQLEVGYKTGQIKIYTSEKTKHLIINPEYTTEIAVVKKEKAV